MCKRVFRELFLSAVGSMKLFFLFSQGNLDNLHKYTKLSLLISAFFLCVRFTCPKSKNIFIKSNVPVTKLKLEKVVFVMFCNVAKPDFYFHNLQMRLPQVYLHLHFSFASDLRVKKNKKFVIKNNVPVRKLN